MFQLNFVAVFDPTLDPRTTELLDKKVINLDYYPVFVQRRRKEQYNLLVAY